MKQITILLAGLCVLLMFAGCGHLDGNNPMGVTGGGANGYGNLGGTVGGTGGDGGGGNIDQQLLGTWRYDISADEYELLIIANGTFQILLYQNGVLLDSSTGTWSTSGGVLTITIQGQTQSGPYSINGNNLSLTINGTTTVWHRVS